jgi:hypothetical protein
MFSAHTAARKSPGEDDDPEQILKLLSMPAAGYPMGPYRFVNRGT